MPVDQRVARGRQTTTGPTDTVIARFVPRIRQNLVVRWFPLWLARRTRRPRPDLLDDQHCGGSGPDCSSGGGRFPVDPPRRSRTVLMDPRHRAVDRHRPVQPARRVRLDVQRSQDPVSRPVLGEPVVPLPDRLPRPELHWQITPRHRGPEPEHDPLNHLPVLPERPTPLPIRTRQ